MASIAGLYGGYTANQEDGSGGRNSFFRGFRGGDKNKPPDQRSGHLSAGDHQTTTHIIDE